MRCTRSRWSVHAASAEALDRLLNLAAHTHDRLRDTPVTGFGLNFDYLRTIDDGPDVPAVLARIALDASLGPSDEGTLGASMTYRRKLDDAVAIVTIAPGESPRQVQVKNGFLHELLAPGEVALGELIRLSFPIARAESEAQLARTLQALSANRRA